MTVEEKVRKKNIFLYIIGVPLILCVLCFGCAFTYSAGQQAGIFPTFVITPTITNTPTVTNVPTFTSTITLTPSFTPTITITFTATSLTQTATKKPTATKIPTSTKIPTATKRPTVTPKPTITETPTDIPLDMSNVGIFKIQAMDYVRAVLKAPSTAVFPDGMFDGDQWRYGKHGNVVTVQSYVDAQNSFGAMLRNNFTVQMTYDTQALLYINLGGQVYGILQK